jgi:hypothetical protein
MQARSDTDTGMTDYDPLPFRSQNRTSGQERLGL